MPTIARGTRATMISSNRSGRSAVEAEPTNPLIVPKPHGGLLMKVRTPIHSMIRISPGRILAALLVASSALGILADSF